MYAALFAVLLLYMFGWCEESDLFPRNKCEGNVTLSKTHKGKRSHGHCPYQIYTMYHLIHFYHTSTENWVYIIVVQNFNRIVETIKQKCIPFILCLVVCCGWLNISIWWYCKRSQMLFLQSDLWMVFREIRYLCARIPKAFSVTRLDLKSLWLNILIWCCIFLMVNHFTRR